MGPQREPGSGNYGSSTEGNLNDALTPEAQAEMRRLMDEQGFGVGIADFNTFEVVDRPAGKTPMDDMIQETGEL